MKTGAHTGRSAADKFIVRDATTENTIWWDNNKALSPQHFEILLQDFLAHAENRELISQDLHAGADPTHRLRARVYTELAWHALFINHLLIVPEPGELAGFDAQFIVINLDRKSTRLNSSHSQISYAVFCLKKKKKTKNRKYKN